MYQPTSPETEARIRQLCADFLAGPWVSANADDIKIERLAGFINRNFAVTLNDDKLNEGQVPLKVMVHLYGNEIVDSNENIKQNGEAAEAVITDEMSQHGLAPKVLGVFPGGRIEEFIQSKNAELQDFENTELVEELGKIFAKIHSLTIPIRKIPDRLDKLVNNTVISPVKVDFGDAPESEKEDYYKFVNFPLEAEVNEWSKLMSKIGPKPVFCHGDLNPNNILLRSDTNETGKRIMTIDFELSSYFYRGFDFAYYLYMRSIIPKIISETEFDIIVLDDKNLERDIKILIETYLNEWKKLTNNNSDQDDHPEHLRLEIDFGKLGVSLLMICFMNFGKAVIKDPKAFKIVSRNIDEYLALKKETFDKYKQAIGHLM